MCSVFRAMPYYQAGSLTITQDSPKDSSYLFTLANTLPKMSGRRLLTSSLDRSLRLPSTSSKGFVISLARLTAGGSTFFIGTNAFEFFSDIITIFHYFPQYN